jgi:hypothetical protein
MRLRPILPELEKLGERAFGPADLRRSRSLSPMPRRLLLVLLDGASRTELEAAIGPYDDVPLTIHVVVPAHVGPLEWLATDETRARSEAGARVLEAEWLLADAGQVGGETGEADPVLAVEDALRRFPADEIVAVGRGDLDEPLLQALRSFGIPVTWTGLSLRDAGVRARERAAIRSLTSGRSMATPFVAFIAANLGFLLLAAVASLVAVLIVWLVGLL